MSSDVHVLYYAYKDYQNGGVAHKIYMYASYELALTHARLLHDTWCEYPIINFECPECNVEYCAGCKQEVVDCISLLTRCNYCKYNLCSEHQHQYLCNGRHDEDIRALHISKEQIHLNNFCVYESHIF